MAEPLKIVVGVRHGHPGAVRALQWAVAEAEARPPRITAVMAWTYLDQPHRRDHVASILRTGGRRAGARRIPRRRGRCRRRRLDRAPHDRRSCPPAPRCSRPRPTPTCWCWAHGAWAASGDSCSARWPTNSSPTVPALYVVVPSTDLRHRPIGGGPCWSLNQAMRSCTTREARRRGRRATRLRRAAWARWC